MRQRIISAIVGLVVLTVVLVFLNTILFNVVIGLIGVIAVLELLAATGAGKHRGISCLCVAVAAAIPFAQERAVRGIMPQVMFALTLVFFIIALKEHGRLSIERSSMMFFFSIFVPLFFSSAVFIRNSFGPYVGGFYLLWALGSAWLSDSGAYFMGRAFGKRKLAPVISPKKTVEGSVGGVIVSCVCMLLIALGYQLLMSALFTPITVNYLLLLALTPVFSVVGMLGDLSASLIKRQYNVKDYGNIMPGHGGVLDRFDSVLFTLPAVFIVVSHIVVAA
jgi:phosphatidate cytidylyltransferase